jgi:hypothetical protein
MPGRDFIREAIDTLMDGQQRTLGDYIGHLNGRDAGGDSYAVKTLADVHRDRPVEEAIASALAIGVVAEQLYRASDEVGVAEARRRWADVIQDAGSSTPADRDEGDDDAR